MFTIYSDSGSDSTMVSNLFIDEYMKSANDAQIKIYLYLLRVMGAHRSTSVSDMADRFNHTEKDVIRSLRYWEKKGLLNLTFDRDNSASGDRLVSICLCRPSRPGVEDQRILPFTGAAADSFQAGSEEGGSQLRMAAGASISYPSEPAVQRTADNAPGTAASAAALSAGGGLSEMQALEKFRSDAAKTQLLFVIEQYIGKPLSLNEIRIIFNISEKLHFSDNLIDYLIQYCVDRGKKDFRYIRKVADNWAASGIMTPAQAEMLQEKAQTAGAPGSPSAKSTSAAKPSGRPRTSNAFNQFEQNSYDFDALEEELLKTSEQ